ncbi:putative holin-like toxin [Staphylococcus epidermidis]|nr:putative holin-like toxin [Staphylococcus epidermidis]
MPMMVSIKSLERRRLLVDISTMLQFGIFLIAFIGLVIELIKLRQKKYIPNF